MTSHKNLPRPISSIVLCSILLLVWASASLATPVDLAQRGFDDPVAVGFKELSIRNQDSETEIAVIIMTADTKTVRITVSEVSQKGDEVVVRGHLRRRKLSVLGSYRGLVDIELIDPDGRAHLEEGILISPRCIPRTRTGRSTFTARIPYQLKNGTTLRVSFLPD